MVDFKKILGDKNEYKEFEHAYLQSGISSYNEGVQY